MDKKILERRKYIINRNIQWVLILEMVRREKWLRMEWGEEYVLGANTVLVLDFRSRLQIVHFIIIHYTEYA